MLSAQEKMDLIRCMDEYLDEQYNFTVSDGAEFGNMAMADQVHHIKYLERIAVLFYTFTGYDWTADLDGFQFTWEGRIRSQR
jgi:hypothetical protein